MEISCRSRGGVAPKMLPSLQVNIHSPSVSYVVRLVISPNHVLITPKDCMLMVRFWFGYLLVCLFI